MSRTRGAKPVLWAARLTILGVLGLSPKAALADDLQPPQISHEPCEFFQKGVPFEIRARFYDDSPIFDPKVLYRTQRETAWKPSPFTRREGSDDFTATIPQRDLRGPLEYFIEAFDENGNGPAHYGSPEAPVKVLPSNEAPTCVQISKANDEPMQPDDSANDTTLTLTEGTAPPPAGGCNGPDAPLYCSGWLWGSLGAVAILGGGFAVYWFALRAEDQPPNRPDSVTLTVTGDDPTVGLGP